MASTVKRHVGDSQQTRSLIEYERYVSRVHEKIDAEREKMRHEAECIDCERFDPCPCGRCAYGICDAPLGEHTYYDRDMHPVSVLSGGYEYVRETDGACVYFMPTDAFVEEWSD